MAGRPRKPTALLEAEGAFKKNPKRKVERKNEPTFRKGVIRPKHLKGLASATWDALVEEMDAIGLLQRVDSQALEAACVAYAQAVSAENAIAKHGMTYSVVDQIGNEIPRKRPEVDVLNAAWGRYRSFCTEFGLTPASRSRLGVGKQEDQPKTLAEVLDSSTTLPDLAKLQSIQ